MTLSDTQPSFLGHGVTVDAIDVVRTADAQSVCDSYVSCFYSVGSGRVGSDKLLSVSGGVNVYDRVPVLPHSTPCPEKMDRQYFGRNFGKFKQLFVNFGTN